MKRKTLTKSRERRRRTNRRRRLKAAALSLGLATAWGGTADGGTFLLNGTVTITSVLSNSATFFNNTATATITLPSKAASTGSWSMTDPILPRSVTLDVPGAVDPEDGFYLGGIIDNADGTSDIVLSFPNGGDGVVGVAWTSVFVDGQDPAAREPLLIAQLRNDPFAKSPDIPVPSEFSSLDTGFLNLLLTPYGEDSTLVAFTGPNNVGEVVGTFSASVVPEPAVFGMVVMAAGIASISVRRRD